MRGRRAAAVIAGVLLLAGAGALGLRAATPPRAAPEPVDAALEAYSSLAIGTRSPIAFSFMEGYVIALEREVVRWEVVQGRPHARVEWWYDYRRRGRQVVLVEWLRPEREPSGAAQVVCSQRRLGPRLHVLDPPQPILRAPLEDGRTWSWRGAVDGIPARATFRIRRPDPVGPFDVEQEVDLGDLGGVAAAASVGGAGGAVLSEHATPRIERGSRVVRYAPGQGGVSESGSFPHFDPAAEPVRLRGDAPAAPE